MENHPTKFIYLKNFSKFLKTKSLRFSRMILFLEDLLPPQVFLLEIRWSFQNQSLYIYNFVKLEI